MLLGIRVRGGGAPDIRPVTVGGAAAIAAGAVVKLSSDVFVTSADDDTAVLGWLLEPVTAAEAAAGGKYHVLIANDFTDVLMRWQGTLPSNPIGSLVALEVNGTGATADYLVQIDDTSNDLFKVMAIVANGTTTGDRTGDYRCWVNIPSSRSQGGDVEA